MAGISTCAGEKTAGGCVGGGGGGVGGGAVVGAVVLGNRGAGVFGVVGGVEVDVVDLVVDVSGLVGAAAALVGGGAIALSDFAKDMAAKPVTRSPTPMISTMSGASGRDRRARWRGW